MPSGWSVVSGSTLRPNFFSRWRDSSLVRPFDGLTSAPLADLAGEVLSAGGGAGTNSSLSAFDTVCISSRAFSYARPHRLAKRRRKCPSFDRIENPIGEEFHAIIHKKPSQSITPHKQR